MDTWETLLTAYWMFLLLQFVIVSLSGWGLLFFGGYKFFTKGKGKKEEVFFLYNLVVLYNRALSSDIKYLSFWLVEMDWSDWAPYLIIY